MSARNVSKYPRAEGGQAAKTSATLTGGCGIVAARAKVLLRSYAGSQALDEGR